MEKELFDKIKEAVEDAVMTLDNVSVGVKDVAIDATLAIEKLIDREKSNDRQKTISEVEN